MMITRRWRLAALSALAMLVTSMPALAREENVVATAPMLAEPIVSNITLGKPVTLHAKQMLMSYRLSRPPYARLTEPHQFDLAGVNVGVAADDVLSLSLADRRMAAIVGDGDRLFCSGPRTNFVAAFVAGWLSRFGAETRVCLIDRDGDSRFETMFLAGAKNPEDRVTRAIAPLTYVIETPSPDDDYRIDVQFRGYTPLGSGAIFDLDVHDHGKWAGNVYLYLNWGSGFVSYPERIYPKVKKEGESALRIGSTRFVVVARDGPNGNITVRFDELPGRMLAVVGDGKSHWVPSNTRYEYLPKE